MKKTVIISTLVLVFLAVIAVHRGYGLDDEAINVNIPFGFYAGVEKMPAGSYTISVTPDRPVLMVRSADGKVGTFDMGTSTTDGTDQSKLTFDHIGDNYFLRTIATENGGLRFDARSIERKYASNNMTPQPVAVLSFNTH